jgi:protein-S-isoprenylcysteine O-methyltransferase Ste14
MNNCHKAYAVLVLTLLSGMGSLALFTIFLYAGSIQFMGLGLTGPELLVYDAVLSLLFFIQHSVMIRKFFRGLLKRFLPEIYMGAVFSLASSSVLFTVIFFWQTSPVILWTAGPFFQVILRVLFFLSIIGFMWGKTSLPQFDPFGAERIFYQTRDSKRDQSPLTLKGPYLWVRHPLYFFTLIMIWSCPVLTADRLLLNILWTGWIIAGTILEERGLAEEFGSPYLEYQRTVPMLFPYRIFPGGRGIKTG